MTRRIFEIATACALLAACATSPTERALAEEYFNLGNAYFEAGAYTESFAAYQRALEFTDDLPATSYNLARLQIDRGDFVGALSTLGELSDSDEGNALYLETTAYVHFLREDYEEATAIYEQVARDHPGRVRAFYNLALIEAQRGSVEAALSFLGDGATIGDDDPEYRWLHAEVAYLAGDTDRALAQLDGFRELTRDAPVELLRLARRLVEWDYYLSALELLETLDPAGEPEILFLVAYSTWAGTDRFTDGLRALEAALEAGFDDANRIALLGAVLWEDEVDLVQSVLRGFEQSAEIELQTATQRAPDPQPEGVPAAATAEPDDADRN